MMNNRGDVARWEAIADSYGSHAWKGSRAPFERSHPQYAKQIMSLLSDAQERANGDLGAGVNDMLNAAKMMLDRMAEALEERRRR